MHQVLALIFLIFQLPQVLSQQFYGIPGCRTTKLDMVFALDGSNSVGRAFPIQLEWVRNFTQNFDISLATTRIGIVQYSSIPQIEFMLSESTNKQRLNDKLDTITLLGGNTRTGRAMNMISEQMFTDSEIRADASQILILLSDGQSQDDVTLAADLLRTKGVITFTVGVGNQQLQRQEELLAIANGEEKQVFSAKDFRSVFNLQQELAEQVCTFIVPDCPKVKVDLAFVIDGSTTITAENFHAYKDFMNKILTNFQISEDETRVSVVQYASVVREEFPLNQYFSRQELEVAINNIQWLTGNTATDDAINYLVDHTFDREKGGRPEIPDLVIILTDGKAQNHTAVERAAQSLQKTGAVVYSVGIGNQPSLDELQDIASDPDDTFVIQAADFSLLSQKERPLINSICKNPEVQFNQGQDPTCPEAATDIIFMVDGSGSVQPHNFENFKVWMKKIVDSFEIGHSYIKFGIIQYNDSPHTEYSLKNEQSIPMLMHAIDDMQLAGGGTQTGKALDYAVEMFDEIAKDSQIERPKVLIVLTDGESQDQVEFAAQNAQDQKIMIFSVGVADANLEELNILSNFNENRIWTGEPYEYIAEMRTELIQAICVEVEPKCQNQEIDVVILLDSSGKVGQDDYNRAKKWIKNVIKSFDIGEYTTNFGLTQFTAKPHDEFTLKDKLSKPDMMAKIDDMVYTQGKTMTGKALRHVAEKLFAPDASKPGTPKVLILLTDGTADDKINVGVRLLKEMSVNIFAIGIGENVQTEELRQIATQPTALHVKQPDSIENINIFRKNLINEICTETKAELICDTADVDIAFLVDSSGSIHAEDYEKQKEWIKDFTKGFNLEYFNIRFSVVQFAGSISTEFDFTRNVTELDAAVDAMEQIRGKTYTGNALEYLVVWDEKWQLFSCLKSHENSIIFPSYSHSPTFLPKKWALVKTFPKWL